MFPIPGWFALVILLQNILAEGQCPKACQCDTFQSRRRITCSGYALFPTGIDQDVGIFQLFNSTVAFIPAEYFSNLQRLSEVTIMHCPLLTEIKPLAFADLRSIKRITISNTGLKTISTMAFGGLHNSERKFINLTGNNISEIAPWSFNNSRRFHSIDLTNNPLKIIDTNAFSDLSNVSYLYFPKQIEKIREKAFVLAHSYHTIRFEQLVTAELEPDTFYGLELVNRIEIVQSYLGVLKNGAFSNLNTVIQIDIQKTYIHTIKNETFRDFDDFGNVTFHDCHIARIDKSDRFETMLNNDRLVISHSIIDCKCHNQWLWLSKNIPRSFFQLNRCASTNDGQLLADVPRPSCPSSASSGQFGHLILLMVILAQLFA